MLQFMSSSAEQKLSWWMILWVGMMFAIILGLLFALWFRLRLLSVNLSGSTLGATNEISPVSSPVSTTSPSTTSTPAPTPTPTRSPTTSFFSSPVPASSAPVQPSPSPISFTLPALPIFDSFENGVSSWQSTGEVQLVSIGKTASGSVKPFVGKLMMQIGTPKNPGKPLSANQLRRWLPAKTHHLQFAYNFFSADYQGFDDPGFTVSINDQVILRKSAADVDRELPQTPLEELDSTGWQTVDLDLSKYTVDQQTILTFRAGNDELNLPSQMEHQSWVYLDSIKIE